MAGAEPIYVTRWIPVEHAEIIDKHNKSFPTFYPSRWRTRTGGTYYFIHSNSKKVKP